MVVQQQQQQTLGTTSPPYLAGMTNLETFLGSGDLQMNGDVKLALLLRFLERSLLHASPDAFGKNSSERCRTDKAEL